MLYPAELRGRPVAWFSSGGAGVPRFSRHGVRAHGRLRHGACEMSPST